MKKNAYFDAYAARKKFLENMSPEWEEIAQELFHKILNTIETNSSNSLMMIFEFQLEEQNTMYYIVRQLRALNFKVVLQTDNTILIDWTE